MNLITVKTFDNTIDAHILMARLENEGVPCFLVDDNLVSINPMYAHVVGGIKLKIHEADQDKAIAVLRDIEQTEITNDAGEIIMCPVCNSTEYYTNFKSVNDVGSFLSVVFSFICGVIPFYVKNVYRCKKCNHEFKI